MPAEQPTWAENITPNELVDLVDATFQKNYGMQMTKRARRVLRAAFYDELDNLDQDDEYETGTGSSKDAAEKFTQLTAGDLSLKHKVSIDPSPTNRTLARYTRVGVKVMLEAVAKAKGYHKVTKRVCPVWPF